MLKKLSLVGLLAVAAFGFTANAATADELQAQITALLAQISQLQGAPAASNIGCYAFTRDLTDGVSGADVSALQSYLASKGMFAVAPTGYFGAITKAAVASWQSANGVMPAAGYFGAVSRAKYAATCGEVIVGDDDTSGDDDDTSNGDFFSGDAEGSLENFDQITSLSNEDVGEDAEDVPVIGVEFDADGADQMVERVNVVIDNPSDVAQDDLEDFIQDVSLWLDGEELARMEVGDASYDRGADEYTFRFVGLEGIVMDGDTAKLEVAVTGPSNVNGDNDAEGWDVTIPDNGIRASSPNGVTETYDGEGTTALGPESFTVESFASANDVELHAKKSDDNPEEQTVLGDSNDSFDADLLGFTLEAEGSDLTVFGLEFDLTTTGPSIVQLADDLTLTCGGDDWSENAATTTVFTDLEFTIDEGDSVDCMLSASMSEIDGTTFAEGDNMSATLDISETDVEDQTGEGLTGTELTGSANGNDQTFISEGLAVDSFETPAPTRSFTADETGEESVGQFIVEFDVTANDSEVWLDKSDEESDGLDGGADNGNGEAGEGVVYTVSGDFGGEGFATSTATLECIANCGDTSDNSGTDFFIDNGDTETYRLTVSVTARQGDTNFQYSVWIDSINWATADATGDQFYTSNLGDDSEADTGDRKSVV